MNKRYESSLFINGLNADDEGMFIINCPHCDQTTLVTNKHIQSVHRTSEGMIGYVRCAAGHTVLHKFAPAYPNPKPPASVIALREQLAAEEAGECVASESVTVSAIGVAS